MEVKGNGWIDQKDKRKTRSKCRKWVIRFRTECGVKSKYCVGTYSDAKKVQDDFYLELLNDKKNGGIKFEEYAKKWIKWRKGDASLSPNTLSRDERMLKTLIYWFGAKSLLEIDPPFIKDVMLEFKSVSGNELSGTGKNMHFTTLSSIMNSAVSDGLIRENPMDKVPMPKRDTKEKKCLDKTQLKHFTDCLDSEPLDGRTMCMYLMIYLGLRSQEAFVVKWDDVNFDKEELHICRAYKIADGSIGPPKSKAGTRTLPIPKKLLTKLSERYEDYKKHVSNVDYVCTTKDNVHMTPSAMRKWYGYFKKRHNIEPISFHELRHTNLTIAARNMGQFDLMRYAGWSSLEPSKIYIHDDNDAVKKAVATMFD